MTTTTFELTCRDPVVSRDGRPFGAGQGVRMRDAGWPSPSVIAGSLRTAIGKTLYPEFTVAAATELLQIQVRGAFPFANGQVYLPAPQDCVVHPKLGPLRVTPQPTNDGGCDWPCGELQPVMLSEEQSRDEFKPKGGPAWWPLDRYTDWLSQKTISLNDRFLNAPEREDRTHAQLDPESGSVEDGRLFTTAALPLGYLGRYGVDPKAAFSARFAEISLAACATGEGDSGKTASGLNGYHSTGGERRLVHWKSGGLPELWNCPVDIDRLLADVNTGGNVKMTLATPGIFQDGWKPGWLDQELCGSPPGSSVRLMLVGVCIQRWRAISGWSLSALPGQPRGPKPVRRMVPAGGVYFFQLQEGSAAELSQYWLKPVSDPEQDRRDGFGLATWGIW